jgi:hypothetical protein
MKLNELNSEVVHLDENLVSMAKKFAKVAKKFKVSALGIAKNISKIKSDLKKELENMTKYVEQAEAKANGNQEAYENHMNELFNKQYRSEISAVRNLRESDELLDGELLEEGAVMVTLMTFFKVLGIGVGAALAKAFAIGVVVTAALGVIYLTIKKYVKESDKEVAEIV